MRFYFLFAAFLLIPFTSGCDSATSSLIERQASKQQEISIRNDGAIEFRGQTVDKASLLPLLIKTTFLTPNGEIPVHKIGEMVVNVDEKTTVLQLQDVVFELQAVGHKVALQSGETKIPIPPLAVVSESISQPVFILISLSAGLDGHLSSTEFSINGLLLSTSAGMAHGAAVDKQAATKGPIQQARATLDSLLSKESSSEVIVELKAPNALLARDFRAACASLIELTDNPNGSSSEVSFWPFGYPREESVDLGSFDIVEQIEFDEPDQENLPTSDQSEFKLD